MKNDKIFYTIFFAALGFVVFRLSINIVTAPVILNLWNPLRLIWSMSLWQGYPLYFDINTGPVIGRVYGPMMPLIYYPAGIFSTPTSAIIFASLISACFYFLPVSWILLRKDSSDVSGTGKIRLMSVLLFSLISLVHYPLWYSSTSVHSDSIFLGFSALSCGIIFFYRTNLRNSAIILSALGGVLAVFSKQVALPIVFVIIGCLYVWGLKRALVKFIVATGLCTAAVLLVLVSFGSLDKFFAHGLFVLGDMPYQFHDVPRGLLTVFREYTFEVMGIALILTAAVASKAVCVNSPEHGSWKQFVRQNLWSVYLLSGLVMLPVSIVGKAKLGGDYNAFSYSMYFLAIAALLALIDFAKLGGVQQRVGKNILSLLCIIYMIQLVPGFFDLSTEIDQLRSNDEKMVYEFSKEHPGEAYFPNNPLAVLMAEKKLYHFSYAVFEREASGREISEEYFKQHIPPNIKYVAFPPKSSYYQAYILKYFPEFTELITHPDLPHCKVYARKGGDF